MKFYIVIPVEWLHSVKRSVRVCTLNKNDKDLTHSKQLPQMRVDDESKSYLTTQHVIICLNLLDGRQAPSYLQDYVYKVASRKCQLQSCGCGELGLM